MIFFNYDIIFVVSKRKCDNVKKYKSLLLLLIMIVLPNMVYAYEDYGANPCGQYGVLDAIKIIGYVIVVVKWVVPFILMVLGMIDFGKATVSNDDKAVAKASKALIRRIIAGVVIFLVPTIVLALLQIVNTGDYANTTGTGTFVSCTQCLFDPANKC